MPDSPLVRAARTLGKRVLLAARARRRAGVARDKHRFDLGTHTVEEVHAYGCLAKCTCDYGIRFTRDRIVVSHRKACPVRKVCRCIASVRVVPLAEDGGAS